MKTQQYIPAKQCIYSVTPMKPQHLALHRAISSRSKSTGAEQIKLTALEIRLARKSCCTAKK